MKQTLDLYDSETLVNTLHFQALLRHPTPSLTTIVSANYRFTAGYCVEGSQTIIKIVTSSTPTTISSSVDTIKQGTLQQM